jgi:hypothetical protein
VVESKDETKKKIGRSPDDADALLLAYLEGVASGAPTPIPNPPRRPLPGEPGWDAHGSAYRRLEERMRRGHSYR